MTRNILFAAIAAAFLAASCATTSAQQAVAIDEPVEAWEASWIGGAFPGDKIYGFTEVNARYLRKEFDLPAVPEGAKLYICGLGLYEAYINGVRIAPDQALSPTPSDYHKTVYYNAFDVTPLLRKGANAIGVILGNGRYVSMRTPCDAEGVNIPPVLHYDTPKLILQLEVAQKGGETLKVCTGQGWKITADGPVRENNEFDGETYDARLEMPSWNLPGFDDSAWKDAETVPVPGGELCLQPNPNIEIQDILQPISITPREGGYIVDMGQNMVGWLRIKGKAAPGDTVVLRFAETLNPDGSLYRDNLRQAKVTDRYIAASSKKFDYHPSFVYHGFRFVEVKGLSTAPKLSDFEGQVFYDKMATTGSFKTSNPIINAVHKNAYWGIRGNYRGMPTDCPQRDERMGWFGDRATGCYGESYIFDNHALYLKWLRDIEESQLESGSLPNVAPIFWGMWSDNITWPGVFVTATDMLWQMYGDETGIIRHYDAIKKWLVFMKTNYMIDGIIMRDTYGDWCMPPERQELIHSQDPTRITAGPILSTSYYNYLCQKMIRFAEVASHPEDIEYFRAEVETTAKAFHEKFFNAEGGYYGNNTVTGNIIPLWAGMVPKELEETVFQNIVDKTEKDFNGHVSTGVVGIQFLMRTLTERGRGDLALKIATNTDYPSWGYMVEKGATTIWELWNGDTADPAMNSGNHVMLLGDLIIWDYGYLAGIRPEEPGFSKILLKPYPIEGLDNVDCSYDSVNGTIKSSWKRSGNGIEWNFTIPEGTTAKVAVPAEPSDELQKAVEAAGGKAEGVEDGRPVFAFPAGSFKLKI